MVITDQKSFILGALRYPETSSSFPFQLDQIARLSARVDQLESELKLSEERNLMLASQLEQETISGRDREKKNQQLQEEVQKQKLKIFCST